MTHTVSELEEILFDEMNTDGYIESNYIPLRFLGKGSFSTVLECKERFSGRLVAIKVRLIS